MARIMIIDDEAMVRETLRRILETFHYDVTEAPDGKVALAEHKKNPVDLIVVDIFMPEKEGLETIQEFKRDHEHVKIIAISGYTGVGSKDFLKSARAFGAERTFTKPISSEELTGAIRALVGD